MNIEEGDVVVMPIKYAENVPPKKHRGKVIAVGKKGVQVRFDDPKRPLLWLRLDQVEVVDRARPDAPASVVVPRAVKEAPVAGPVAPAAPQSPAQTIASLDAWRAMGAELMEEARLALHFDEIEMANADEDLVVSMEKARSGS